MFLLIHVILLMLFINYSAPPSVIITNTFTVHLSITQKFNYVCHARAKDLYKSKSSKDE